EARRAAARPDARPHAARDRVDDRAGARPAGHHDPHPARDLPDPGRAAGPGARGHGAGPPVVVGVPLPDARPHDGQRAAPGGRAAEGKAIFTSRACVGCHAIRGVSAGVLGPDLTTFGSRRTLAAGLVPNTPANVAAWVKDPGALKPGVKMPVLGLTDDQAKAVAAYLESLK